MKDNKDTISLAIITFAGIVLAGIFLLWVFGAFRQEKEAGDAAMGQIAGVNGALLESKYTTYDGTVLKGSAVINAIRNFEAEDEQINIVVNNGNGETNYCYNSDLKTKANSLDSSKNVRIYSDKSNLATYINPSANFTGVVVRDDKTNTIIGIKFTYVSKTS